MQLAPLRRGLPEPVAGEQLGEFLPDVQAARGGELYKFVVTGTIKTSCYAATET